MQDSKFRFLLLILCTWGFSLHTAFAGLDADKVSTARRTNAANSSSGSKAFAQSIGLSLMQTQNRMKLPGAGNIYLEAGFHSTSLDTQSLAPFTTSGNPPEAFYGIEGRLGFGLPWGFALEGGLSQILNEDGLNAANMSLAYQILDFSTWVYTDYVPAVSMDISGMRTIAGPATWGLSGQLNLGGYHRQSRFQLGYAFKYVWNLVVATTSSYSQMSLLHGLIAQAPLTKNLFVRSELFVPNLQGTMSLGFQF